jgi:hypothetical protein
MKRGIGVGPPVGQFEHDMPLACHAAIQLGDDAVHHATFVIDVAGGG